MNHYTVYLLRFHGENVTQSSETYISFFFKLIFYLSIVYIILHINYTSIKINLKKKEI